MALTQERNTARGKIAALSRSRSSDDPELIEARRVLAAEKLADYIKRTVETAPPLSDEQRDRLVALIRLTSIDGGAA